MTENEVRESIKTPAITSGDLAAFHAALLRANLVRVWWMILISTSISIVVSMANIALGVLKMVPWQIFDIAGSFLFLVVVWLARTERLSLFLRKWIVPGYFIFWLIIMDGYYFYVLLQLGETATYELGVIAPAILIILNPKISLALLWVNHVFYCTLLISKHLVAGAGLEEQVMAAGVTGLLGVAIASLASWFLYRAALANFLNERQILKHRDDARNMEARLRSILENIPFLVWLKDPKGRMLAMNAKMAAQWPSVKEDVPSVYGPEAESPEIVRLLTKNDHALVEAGQRMYAEEKIDLPEGVRWYEIFKSPVFDSENKIAGITGLARDITERKEIESKLVEADRAKSEFLATMSHEIRTPLNSVLGYAQLLEECISDPEQQSYVRSIGDSGNLLLRIINDILDFSKIEMGELHIERAPVDLRKLFERVYKMFKPLTVEKSLDFQMHIHGDVPPYILGDSHRIEQVLVNLVSNAMKFTEEGQVKVEATWHRVDSARPELSIMISDTGIGISEDHLSRLFKSFSQLDTSIARRFGGTGLGLVIARRLCQIMGGNIEVTSELGKGSVFTAHFAAPAADKENHSQTEKQNLSKDSPLWDRHVLVVEDSSSNRKLIQAMLVRWGMRVTLAESGREALEYLFKEPFDAILMDVQMPGMDGLEVTRRIREWERKNPERPRNRILAFTAMAMKGDMEKCSEAGMDGYISKPVNMSSLQHALIDLFYPQGIFSSQKTLP